ncbi:hypothetical protein SEA_IBANTIK_26 [Streptomyces phage Ibantik]|uniref:Uncharacterized protein n=1 Tax=Streptomyces phage Ibantik TaxID=2182397 RepID=A0A2U8UNU3_9CAUD|nr:hypothetical protein QEH36_gp026 [Streptomyces phage Ibantik]AWN05250.1 hypothetical protein SEA_IBANTIK_26 [Streptomyces phage Ibantik]
MTDFDPTAPWGQKSPWDQAQPENTNTTAPEAPVTNQPAPVAAAPNPFKIGITLKAASGYDAEWLTPTVYGASADEVASRTVELLNALKQYKIIEYTANAADYTRGQFLGGGKSQPAASKPSFDPGSGQVQYNQAPAAPAAGGFTCNHGARTHKTGNGRNGPWEAMMCPTPKGTPDQCPPMWKQKDGTFK